ncbi:CatB-related O-acetyltransferase [Oryzibacter oryziterrae]|uniref:CatB-related O-acetyltransferase n=1 Tax=Oryzibacter oryziterrae TaxID=2766474 RepID=UPI001F47F8FC|nr:CatB-related O-acetyltransferase [Oryzibacter oryziterrae]
MAHTFPHPDPSIVHPMPEHPRVVFLKAVVDAPNVEIGDFSYYDDPVEPERFYEKCVLYHYPFLGDRLVIGRFVAIATGVSFIMGGANHLMGGISTFPFQIFASGWEKDFDMAPILAGLKGDTLVGNDVWIGRRATILPGVRIGDGAIIAAEAVVSRDVPPYAIVAGNPARVVRRRFDEGIVDRLLAIAWWNWPAERITQHLQLIMGADVDALERVSGETP